MHGEITKGRDPEYFFRQMNHGKTARQEAQPQRGGAEYYHSAAAHGGEPPGEWVGEALAQFGIHDGDEVKQDDFLPLYGEFRIPGTDEHLGSRPRESAKVREIFTELRAGRTYAELGREEVRRLWTEARAQAGTDKRAVMYLDYTFSVDKTISLAAASAQAQADQARRAGDLAGAALWQGRADMIWEEIDKAVREGIDYLQREAQYVRTGHHGKGAAGVDLGVVEDAGPVPVALWRHHTNRDGEIHLHVHTTWLNKVERRRDGVYQAWDARELYRAKRAASRVAGLRLEAGISQRAGLEWVYRPESKGRVIAGTPEKAIAAFSSRRATIKGAMPGMIEAYRAQHGVEPDRRTLWTMRQMVARETRQAKPEGGFDYAQMLRQWDAQSRGAELGTLTALARTIWARGDRDSGARPEPLTPAQEQRVMTTALATITEAKNRWNRHDLVAAIAEALPDHAVPPSPELARAMLEDLATRTLAGEAGERVACLNPSWPEFPKALCRESDGESIYRPHGGQEFAATSALSAEQRMLAQAGEMGAPAIERARAAQLLGSDQETLETYIAQGCPVSDARTTTGLRMDQAVAAYRAASSGRRVEITTGPAGTGKSYTAGAVARAWLAAGMGPVYGVALTSNARNELAKTCPGIRAYNFAEFLGHTKEEREARPGVTIEPGALILVDEATMPSNLDWRALLDRAQAANAAVRPFGDHGQLGSPEAGGVFGAIARRQGEVQLNVAERVIHPDDPEPEWEADASLALRAGGPGAVEALREYDDHGKLHGGTFEEMAEQAARHFLYEFMAGRNVLMCAQTHQECGELARRVQESLLKWGKVHDGPSAALAGGAEAYRGDWLTATENVNIWPGAGPKAGPDARRLVNSDTVQVEAIGQHRVTVRLLTGHGADGPQWGEPFTVPRSYLASHGRLDYARTWITAQGRNVAVGITLANDSRDRRGLYESFLRGTEDNHAYAYPSQGDPAEPDEHHTDPEVARQEKLAREASGGAAQVGVDSYDPVSILGPVVGRHDEQLLGSEVGHLKYREADNLAYLHSIWDDQVRRSSGARFAAAVRTALPEYQAADVLEGSTDDLWRALRHAELAGKDGGEVLAGAVAAGPLDDARSVGAVLARRVRDATEHLPPVQRGSWESRAPVTGDAETDRWLREEIGRGMDQRQERLGRHIAETAPVWATRTFGPVPEGAGERAVWEEAAGVVGAFRERFGWDHEGEAIGPRPATTHPEARAEWAAALEVMPRVDGVDVRHLTAGQLLTRRAAAQREYAWQPPDAAEELRLARKAGLGAKVEAARAKYDAEAAEDAGDLEAAARHRETERQHDAVAALAGVQEEKLAEVHATRKRWNAMTEPTRRTGEAADLAAKQQGIVPPEEEFLKDEPDMDDEREAETQEERDKSWLTMLGLTPDTDGRVPEVVEDKQRKAREAQEEINYRLSQRIPDEDPDFEDIGPAWKDEVAKERDAVIQPPKPVIEPAEQAKEHGWEFETAHPADREAGD